MVADAARRCLASLDLTALGDGESLETTDALCARAATPHGPVAAVCLWPRFVRRARRALAGTGVRVAAVANFPLGTARLETVRDEIARLVDDGADDVDAVMPYGRWLAGETGAVSDFVAECREACGPAICLKVILETGAFPSPAAIRNAADVVIAAGADFLKTSTGKRPPSATPEAAQALLDAIAAAPQAPTRRPLGFKASGGIRTAVDAARYLALADQTMGAGWASPATFRIGASRVLDDLLAVLGEGAPASA